MPNEVKKKDEKKVSDNYHAYKAISNILEL